MDLLNNLNPMQAEAVKTIDGALLLLAGAGSGKTRVITHRIAYLIENGISPYRILAITFTNKAAKEMKERASKITPYGSSVLISTFHSLCVRILRKEIEYLGYGKQFTIYDTYDSVRTIKDILKEMGKNEKNFNPKSILNDISTFKNELMSPTDAARQSEGDYSSVVVAEIYAKYEERLKNANSLDFDDLIYKTVLLFKEFPQVLEKYQDRFEYIMVDEYQDTNNLQYTLINFLAKKHKNLCVVGDDDQSIYGWRGANIQNILDFEKDYPNCKTIKLEQNYRSTSYILNAANEVIKNNFSRKPKKLWTANNTGEKIKYAIYENDRLEALNIASIIAQKVKDGASYNDFAVLYRANSLSRIIEDSFVKNSIPYRLLGGTKFYDRLEIKDMVSYLKAIYNPNDNMALKRIINTPKRGIGDTSINKIDAIANDTNMTFYQAINDSDVLASLGSRAGKFIAFNEMLNTFIEKAKTQKPSELINDIFVSTTYKQQLELENTPEALGRIENVEELIAKAVEFEENFENPTLADFLEEVALVADIDDYSETSDTVVLMTLHSSKGLEFPTVFIPAFEDGIFPSFQTFFDENQLEEERRLMYVGITRARQELYLTCAKQRLQYNEYKYYNISRFFKEIPKEYKEDVSPTKIKPSVIPPKKTTTRLINGYNPYKQPVKNLDNMDFNLKVGDRVLQTKYGIGEITEITPKNNDYEVSISFTNGEIKKFLASIAKLKKL